MKKIDRITTIELEGKVVKRLYTGTSFVDAEISPEAALVDIADSSKVVVAVLQRRALAGE